MQNFATSFFSASSAHRAAEALLGATPASGMAAFFSNVEGAMRGVEPQAAEQFANQRGLFLNHLGDDTKEAQRAYDGMVRLMRGLNGSWLAVRRRLQNSNRSVRREIASLIGRFEIGRRLLPHSARYLKTLLDEAELYGHLPAVLQLVRQGVDRPRVRVVEEGEQVSLLNRSVDDFLAKILVYLLIEDYQRVGEEEHPARRKILAEAWDVVVHPIVSSNASFAIYVPSLQTLFLDFLPEIEMLYEFDKREGMPDFPTGGLLLQELYTAAQPYRHDLEIMRQVIDWIGGSAFLRLKKGEAIEGDRKKVFELYEAERLKNARLLKKKWGESMAVLFLCLYRPVQADFLESARAYLDCPGNEEAWFIPAYESYWNTQVAVVLHAVLEDGIVMAHEIAKQVKKRALHGIPRLFLEEGFLKVVPVEEPLSHQRARHLLLLENGEVIRQLAVADKSLRVSHEEASRIRKYFLLYAWLAHLELSRGKGGEYRAVKIVTDYLLPLIRFVTEREYHNPAV